MQSSPRSCARRQRGIAALAVTVLIFFVMVLGVAYVNRNLVFEHRGAVNQYRVTQSFAAHAGCGNRSDHRTVEPRRGHERRGGGVVGEVLLAKRHGGRIGGGQAIAVEGARVVEHGQRPLETRLGRGER